VPSAAHDDVTVARQVLPDRICFITRRCTQRQFLLTPSAFVMQAYLYCLAEAAQRFAITLYGWIAMGNHEHLLVHDHQGNVPAFLEHFHKMVAKVLNAYHDRSENFWSSEQPSIVYPATPQDAFDKLVYVLANPVLKHLVERAGDWPGASSFRLHLNGQSPKVSRPRLFFRSDGRMPAEITLRVARLKGYEHLTEEEWRKKVLDAVQALEEGARRQRAATGLRIAGRKKILAMSPTDSPKTAAPRRTIRPVIACRDPLLRAREVEALRGFRIAYRAALQRFRLGERDVEFPLGTYAMLRFRAHFREAPPPPAARRSSISTTA
jgi:putative transposase